MVRRRGWLWLTRSEQQTVRRIRTLEKKDQDRLRLLIDAMCRTSLTER